MLNVPKLRSPATFIVPSYLYTISNSLPHLLTLLLISRNICFPRVAQSHNPSRQCYQLQILTSDISHLKQLGARTYVSGWLRDPDCFIAQKIAATRDVEERWGLDGIGVSVKGYLRRLEFDRKIGQLGMICTSTLVRGGISLLIREIEESLGILYKV